MAGLEFTFTANTTGLVSGLEAAIGPAEELEAALRGVRDAEAEVGAGGAGAAAGLGEEAAAADAAAASMKLLRTEHARLATVAKRTDDMIRSLGDALRDQKATGDEAAAAAAALGAAQREEAASSAAVRDERTRAAKATKEADDAAKGLSDTLRKQKRDQDQVARSIAELEKASADGGIGTRMAFRDAEAGVDDYLSKVQEARKVAQEAASGIDDLQGATSRHEIAAISAAHGLKDGSRDAQDFGDALKDVGRAGKDLDAGGGAGLFERLILGGGGFAGSQVTGALSSLKETVTSPMTAILTAAVGMAAGAVPAVLSLGAGFGAFGAMAAPALLKVKTGLSDVTYAQQQYELAKGVEARDPTKSNLEAQQKDLAALKTTWAQLPAPVAGAVHEVQSFEKAWGQASKKAGIQKDALGDIKGLAKDARDAIPAVTQLAKATAPIVHGMIGDLGKEFKSKGFKQWVDTLTREEKPASQAMKHIGSALGGFVTQLTSREAKPGTQMLNNIGSFLKTITPGTVTGLTGLTKGVSGLFAALNKAAGSKDMSATVADTKSIAGNLGSIISDVKDGDTLRALGNTIPNLVGFGKPFKKPVTVPVKPKLENLGPGGIGAGWAGSVQKLIAGYKHESAIKVRIQPEVDDGDLMHSLDQGQALKRAGSIKVKVKPDTSDVASQVSKATTGKDIAVKGHVTLSGLAAGIQKQIASLHIPDSKVKITVSVSGVSAVKGQMSSVVGAAQRDAAGAKGALGSLAGAGDAAGAALGAGLAAGIAGSEGAVVAAATAVAQAAANAVKAAAAISSPSKVWKGLGKNMTEGLVLGLEGGKSAVDAAAKLLGELPFRDSHVAAAIKTLRKDVQKAFKENKITGGEEDNLLNQLDIGNKRLLGLVQRRQSLVKQIRAADALAKSVRQGAVSYADITGIAGIDSAGVAAQANPASTPGSIQAGQKSDLKQIRQFTADIRKLKKEGLDKQSIKELLAAGVSGGLPAAQQLLQSGKAGVKESAKLQKEIIDASKKLGITGANAAYESGSQIGKGLAAGLKSELGSVVKAIDAMAKKLVDEIRKELGLPPLKGGSGGKGGGSGHGGGAGGGSGGSGGGGGGQHELPGGGHTWGRGGGNPVDGKPVIIHTHQHIYLDGKQISVSVQTQQLRHARRNVATGNKLANRGV